MNYMLMSMLAPLSTWSLVAGLVLPFMLYVIARWRAQREAIVDPQLGIKVALNFFACLAFQVLLVGAALLVFAMLTTDLSDDRGTIARVAFGLVVPAAIVLVVHLALLRRTNDAQFPGVRRLFLGYTLLTTGLAGFTGLVLVCEALFMKDSAGDFGRAGGAVLIVFGGAWAAIGWLFGKLVLGPPPSAPSAPTPVIVTPPTTPGA